MTSSLGLSNLTYGTPKEMLEATMSHGFNKFWESNDLISPFLYFCQTILIPKRGIFPFSSFDQFFESVLASTNCHFEIIMEIGKKVYIHIFENVVLTSMDFYTKMPLIPVQNQPCWKIQFFKTMSETSCVVLKNF